MYQISRILTINCTLILLFLACSGDDVMEPISDEVAFEGNFISAAHPTSGVASINNDRSTLFLTNFKTDNGPDLNIYLATNISDVENEYIDLGDLKGLNGSYTYDLQDNVDFTDYKYVVVWCIAATVNFGYAELEAK